MEKYNKYRPGILVSIVLAGIAISIERQYPILWSAAIAFILGFALKSVYKVEENWVPGLKMCGRLFLKYGFAVSGFSLSFSQMLVINQQTIKLLIIVGILLIQIEKIKQTNHKLMIMIKQHMVLFIGIFLIGLCINSLGLIPIEGMTVAGILAKWLFALGTACLGVEVSLEEDK